MPGAGLGRFNPLPGPEPGGDDRPPFGPRRCTRWDGDKAKTIRDNGPSTLGFPFAGLSAFVLVLLLKISTQGDLKFDELSMNLTGPSSELMY